MPESKADSYTSFDKVASNHFAKHHAGRNTGIKKINTAGEPKNKSRMIGGTPGNLRG